MNINMKMKRCLGMKGFKKLHLLQLIFLLKIFVQTSISEEISASHCGSIRVQPPFLHPNSSHDSSLLSHMIFCKSEKLYFRTTIGLFPVSSIDYTNKLLIVSHTSSSSTSHFLSPRHLSSGFPPPSKPNSLVLFNCSNPSPKVPLLPCNKTHMIPDSLAKGFSYCSVIDDVEKVEKSFDPKEMNCTHYIRAHRSSEKLELGTSISFDVPDHVPNPCNQCEKPDGNCGAGLRCLCHPKKCKDKVVSSMGAVVKPFCNMLVSLVLIFFFMMDIFHRF